MTVACRRYRAVSSEKIEFYSVSASKRVIHPVHVLRIIAGLVVFFGIFGIYVKYVVASYVRAREPREVIYSNDVDVNIIALNLDSRFLFVSLRYEVLSCEYLMAAAKRLDCGEEFIKGSDAHGHRIGVIDYPCVRAIVANALCNNLEHRYCSERAYNSAGTCAVTNGLIDPVFFRGVNVYFHFIKRSGEN